MKSEVVYKEIKEQIIYGKIKPGTVLTVSDLAQQFNVSKTPVRDSLNLIIKEGLVEVLPYKGYLVTRLDVKTMQDLFQMRVILEGAAAELAAKNVTPLWAKKLDELATVDIQEDSLEGYNIRYIQANFDFHTAIAQVSNNDFLRQSIGTVLNLLQRVLYIELIIGDQAEMRFTHLELADLISRGEADHARQLVTTQLEASKKRMFLRV
jgi:DNA-binding GntR family transcriptional regulator